MTQGFVPGLVGFRALGFTVEAVGFGVECLGFRVYSCPRFDRLVGLLGHC